MSSSLTTLVLILTTLLTTVTLTQPQPQLEPLNKHETDLIYKTLTTINPNPTTPWLTLYPSDSDICLSPPHGIVCSYFSNLNSTSLTPHVTELNLGYISDSSPNPTCSSRATFPISSISSFPHLRKLLFYRCFTSQPVFLPPLDRLVSGSRSEIEEIVFIDNVALTGSILSSGFGNFNQLRRFIFTGSGNLSGGIPDEITDLPSVQELTISRNPNLGKVIPINIGKLGKLKILDLSNNGLIGNIPDSIGEIGNLIKLDLSFNNLTGKIPENLGELKNLEFLDLGFNQLGKFGVPIFLGKLINLKEVYLSGNLLGGVIPEIWGNLGNILGVGFSGLGLIGNIPSSMGVNLRNASFILLDNNKLDGVIPKEFELLSNLNELNLQNNRLSGKLPLSVNFVSRIGSKLKLEGNLGICVDKSMRWSIEKIGSGLMGLDTCNITTERDYDSTLLIDRDIGSSSTRNPSLWVLIMVVFGVFW